MREFETTLQTDMLPDRELAHTDVHVQHTYSNFRACMRTRSRARAFGVLQRLIETWVECVNVMSAKMN
jgi:hypothetical protein